MPCWRHELSRLIITSLLALLSISTASTAEDTPRWDRESQLGQPLFVISAHKRLIDDPQRIGLDVIVEVMNDMLMFVKTDDEFVASVNLELAIINTDNNKVVREVKHVTKRVQEYNLTNSRRDFAITVFSHDLPPGSYNIEVQLEDNESRHRETVKKEVDLKISGTSMQFDVSDIVLACSSELQGNSRIPLHPTVSGIVVDPSSSVFCYFDLFRDDPSKPCEITVSVIDKSGKIRYADSLSIIGGAKLSPYFISIPCNNLTFNHYNILLKAVYNNSIILRNAAFSINFHGLPWLIGDLDQAIKQLRHVASAEEIRRLSNAFPSRKEEIFIEFWSEKFPVENEQVNGKMVEYYNRVNFANLHYGNNRAGWETDRGRILIIYGQPTEVERSESDMGSLQYEIWYYNHLNRRFVFKDEFGFGEYRLVSPGW